MQKRKKLFRNKVVDKKELKQVMSWAFSEFGLMKASYLANKLKDLGFHYATQAGLSISIEDLRVPPIKASLIKLASEKALYAEFEVHRGEITEVERFQKVINTWNTTSENLKDQVVDYFQQSDPLNSIYIMAFSGARGNLSQVRQLVGMRGLMADPNGQIIDLPIVTNFREGLTVTDYIISSYGARKGLVDTALRTADSGYLTRRLIDVAQDIITREKNCKTKDGISLSKVMDGNNLFISLSERVLGRLLALPIQNPQTNQLMAKADEVITPWLAQEIAKSELVKLVVRSPLTCASSRSICQHCYGWNLAYGSLIDLGEAVGILAAQSIGEPGTQLTMRTFHTGGVFTTEPSRQIRAQFSGKIIFPKTLRLQKIRTMYGEKAFISENKASLSLITYTNQKISIEILPETLILVHNQSYVKKNDILFELISTTKKTGGEKAYKYVHARFSGQVILENQQHKKAQALEASTTSTPSNCLVWILAGQVYNVPLHSKLHLKTKRISRKNHTLAEAKLFSTTGGIVQDLTKKKDLNILHYSQGLKNLNLYLEESFQKLRKSVVYGSKNRRIHLHSLSAVKQKEENLPCIGSLTNLNYQTKTGGIFYSDRFSAREDLETFSHPKQKTGGSIFYIPESIYQINKDITQLYVKNGDFVSLGTEIFKDHFTSISGIVDINEHKKMVKDISIKPGQVFLVGKEKGLKSLHQKIVYPGEVLFGFIEISQLSFTEVKVFQGQTFFRIYPVVRYEITQDPKELSYFSSQKERMHPDVQLGALERCFHLEKKIKTNAPLQLIKRSLLCDPRSTTKSFMVKVDFTPKKCIVPKTKLSLLILEKISFAQHLPNELKKQDIAITSLVKHNQYAEPYTSIASFQVLIPEKNEVVSIKEQFLGKERMVYVTTQEDFKKVFVEEANTSFLKDQFVRFKEKTKTNFLSQNAGLVYKRVASTLLLQKGQAYLFSKGAIIKKRPGDLIKKGESLGQLVYERARTGDIVQGLPKVEEVLEGRKPKTEALLAKQPGIITEIAALGPTKTMVSISSAFLDALKTYSKHLTQKKEIKAAPKAIENETLSSSHRLLISKFEFINVGQPFNDASINPHALLEVYFLYYGSLGFLSPYESAYRSLRKIQALLLTSVQGVYYSQGVKISDKHVEIIVKQMTGKVQIKAAGESSLLMDEFIDLRQAYYINACLGKKENALFRPVLFGITKASLKTNSFISAASFQHTTRVLTEAAIQGKIDWLRGLKESVIVGRLIPTGTGYNANTDISYLSVKVPVLVAKPPILLDDSLTPPRSKYSELKNKIKFKMA